MEFNKNKIKKIALWWSLSKFAGLFVTRGQESVFCAGRQVLMHRKSR